MATRGSSSVPKRERSIPIKVTVDTTPREPLPPPVQVAPSPAPSPRKKTATVLQRPVKQLATPVHEWPEEKRRRLMWWLVAGGTAAIVIGWLALIRYEVSNGRNVPNIFAEAARLLRTVHWPGTAQPSKAEQEIRQLDQQVFPQFQ